MQSRRTFIKKSCGACLAIAGIGTVSSLLSGCITLPVYKATISDNTIIIPTDNILPEEKLKIIRSPKLDYDILLVIEEDKNHKALLMKCSHFANGLIANKQGLSCNLHGSTFNLKGEATSGPASQPLTKFKTIEDADHITIYLN